MLISKVRDWLVCVAAVMVMLWFGWDMYIKSVVYIWNLNIKASQFIQLQQENEQLKKQILTQTNVKK